MKTPYTKLLITGIILFLGTHLSIAKELQLRVIIPNADGQLISAKGFQMKVSYVNDGKPSFGEDDTNDFGVCKISLPDTIQYGHPLEISVEDKKNYRVFKPYLGKLNLPQERSEVEILPVGSELFLSDPQIEFLLKYIIRQATEQVDNTRPEETIDVQRYLDEYAKSCGIKPEVLTKYMDDWMQEWRKKETIPSVIQALLQVYSKDFTKAATSFEVALTEAEQDATNATDRVIELALLSGDSWYNAHNFPKAIERYKKSLERIDVGENPIQWAEVANRLVISYAEGGNYEEGLLLAQSLYNLSKKKWGVEHPKTLTYVNNLASIYQNKGDYEKALRQYTYTLDMRELILGDGHPDTLMSMNNLASLYQSMGNYNEALLLCKKALKGYEDNLGLEHGNTINVMNNLALIYNKVGNNSKSIELHKRALEALTNLWGAEHPNTLTGVNNLAGSYQSMGDYVEALHLFRIALRGREQLLGLEHPSTITSINNLAGVYSKH